MARKASFPEGEDPRYGLTVSQLSAMRAQITIGLDRLHGKTALEERRRLKAAHDLYVEGIRARLEGLRVEVRKLHQMLVMIDPRRFSGSPMLQSVAALLMETDGRIWASDLLEVARRPFEIKSTTVWSTVRRLELEGMVRVHHGKRGRAPTWVEVVSMTGGDGVPPKDGTGMRRPMMMIGKGTYRVDHAIAAGRIAAEDAPRAEGNRCP